MDLGDVDFGRAVEGTLLGDLDHARVHGGLHRAFDDQRVAVGDLHALELDVGAHGQLAAAFGDLAGRAGGGGCHVHVGHGLRGRRLLGLGLRDSAAGGLSIARWCRHAGVQGFGLIDVAFAKVQCHASSFKK